MRLRCARKFEFGFPNAASPPDVRRGSAPPLNLDFPNGLCPLVRALP